MHRLQASEDLSFFSGAYLLQVCVGRNEVIVNFDRDVSLTILSDFAVQPQGGILERFEDPLKGSGAVFTLLHDTVTLAEATAEGDLKIRFASGGSLIVFDTSSQYESFWIRHGKQEIVV